MAFGFGPKPGKTGHFDQPGYGMICCLMTVMPVPLPGPINACRREIEPEEQMSLQDQEMQTRRNVRPVNKSYFLGLEGDRSR